MNCMKCGRELEEEHLFCAVCLADMEKYPVKPGTAIQLPQHRELSAVKRTPAKRRAPTPEETIQRLRKRVRNIFLLWLLTVLLLAATAYPTLEYLAGRHLPLPGQNYTTVTGSNPSVPSKPPLP